MPGIALAAVALFVLTKPRLSTYKVIVLFAFRFIADPTSFLCYFRFGIRALCGGLIGFLCIFVFFECMLL